MNNNSKAAAKRTQIVYSEPQFVLVGNKEKTCQSGKVITVNRYRKNPNAKPIRTIQHATIPGDTKRKAFNVFNRFKNR